MTRIETEYSHNEGFLHDQQMYLFFRTQLEVEGNADPKMIEENERWRADFVKAADLTHYSDGLGLCSWLRMGIDRVSTEELNRVAYGVSRSDYLEQHNPGGCRNNLNSDPLLKNIARYLLKRRSGSGYGSEEDK